jgi:hypothetical protein
MNLINPPASPEPVVNGRQEILVTLQSPEPSLGNGHLLIREPGSPQRRAAVGGMVFAFQLRVAQPRLLRVRAILANPFTVPSDPADPPARCVRPGLESLTLALSFPIRFFCPAGPAAMVMVRPRMFPGLVNLPISSSRENLSLPEIRTPGRPEATR